MTVGPIFPNQVFRSAPPQLDARTYDIRLITIDLASARTDEELSLKGNFVWAANATTLNSRIDIRFNNQAGDVLPLLRGVSIGGVPFTRLYISNTAQAGETITLFSAVEPKETSFLRITNPDVNLVNASGLNNADDDVSVATGLTREQAFLYGYDGTTWDRLRTQGNNGDALAQATLGLLKTAGYTYVYSEGSATWNRAHSEDDDNDARAVSATDNKQAVMARNQCFNETSYDRVRGNTLATLISAIARTADVTTATQTNYNARGVHIIIDVTAYPAAASVVAKLQGLDNFGTAYSILESPAIVAVGTYEMKVYPGITAVANQSANDVLPRSWNLFMDHASADSITYRVSVAYIV